MGASLGNWEFLSQTNDNADCVPEDDRFKFVDDLTTLEVINLLTVGLSSFHSLRYNCTQTIHRREQTQITALSAPDKQMDR
jgi:hypothetical protein